MRLLINQKDQYFNTRLSNPNNWQENLPAPPEIWTGAFSQVLPTNLASHAAKELSP
jgi:hypothetical protein